MESITYVTSEERIQNSKYRKFVVIESKIEIVGIRERINVRRRWIIEFEGGVKKKSNY